MPTLVPVDHDPFGGQSSATAPAPAAAPNLAPVDNDPFAQSMADKYAGWDQFSAPQAAPKVPLADKPGVTYGQVLPFATDNATGKTSLAVPQIIREPFRGVIEGGQEARGKRPVDDPSARGDIAAAAMALGGGVRGVGEYAGGAAKASPIKPGAAEAREAGYVLTPAEATKEPGIVANALSAWSGKIKKFQEASSRNQEVTNNLAAEGLGVMPGKPLMPNVFQEVRENAGKFFKDVINAAPTIRADSSFRRHVAALGSQNSDAAKAFPGIMGNQGVQQMIDELGRAGTHPTGAWIELVKQLRYNAVANMKKPGDPTAHALGVAQRQAANTVDELLDRQLSLAGKPDLVAKYRAGRQMIAKSYDVEAATNSATGDVNAQGLAKLAKQGKPLTGELRQIANAALAFPKSTQNPAAFGGTEPWSVIDFLGSAGAMAHGNPALAGAFLGRPAARSALFSNTMQNRMMQPGGRMPASVLVPPGQPGNDGAQTAAEGLGVSQ